MRRGQRADGTWGDGGLAYHTTITAMWALRDGTSPLSLLGRRQGDLASQLVDDGVWALSTAGGGESERSRRPWSRGVPGRRVNLYTKKHTLRRLKLNTDAHTSCSVTQPSCLRSRLPALYSATSTIWRISRACWIVSEENRSMLVTRSKT